MSFVSHAAILQYASSYFHLAWLDSHYSIAPLPFVKLILLKLVFLAVSHRGCSKWGKDDTFGSLRGCACFFLWTKPAQGDL